MILRRSKLTNLGNQTAVWFFPSYGYCDGEQTRLVVAGAAYRPQAVRLRKKLLVKLLRRAMRVSAEELDSELFRRRIQPFIASPHRGRRLAVRLEGQIHALPGRSRRNGHFRATLTLPASERDGQDRWIDFEALRLHGMAPVESLEGRVQVLACHGVSVISDIDDTIKETGVGCRKTLLQNTFLREFQEVAGMARRYRQWADAGAAFHYVSSSPWQLYAPLDQWRLACGLPEGTYHLRQFHLGDHMLRRLLRLRRHGKARVIRDLVRRFPQRRFVLVGDSSEHDPEIYGALARRFPDQITAIYIRDMHRNPLDEERAERALRGVDPLRWSRFDDATQLPVRLDTGQLV